MVKGKIKYATFVRSTGLIKTHFKKLLGMVEAIFLGSDQTPVPPVQIRLLNTYLNELKRKHEDFETNFQIVLKHVFEEDLAESNLLLDQDDINDLFVAVVSQIKSLLPADDTRTPSSEANASFCSLLTVSQHVRLPQLDLKTFNGDTSQ